ncbi:hypothetical protein D3C81_843930 [compost metagenome]
MTTFDAGFGYTFGPGLGLQDPTVAMNVTNLTNRRYAGRLSLFAPSAPNGTRHASNRRQAFIALGAGF